MVSLPILTSRFQVFGAWRSARSRTNGPRSTVTEVTMAATRIAAARPTVADAQPNALMVTKLRPATSLIRPAARPHRPRRLPAHGSRRRAVAAGPQLVLHLHRFDDHERLAGVNGAAGGDGNAHDFTRHRRHDPVRPRFGLAAVVLAAAPAGVERDGNGIVPTRTLSRPDATRAPHDLVGRPPADDQRKMRRRTGRVNVPAAVNRDGKTAAVAVTSTCGRPLTSTSQCT